MLKLADLARTYQDELKAKYGDKMCMVHYQALQQIITCHKPDAGEIRYHCNLCHHDKTLFPSCGNRNCPACQQQSNRQWLEAQQQKLLPVPYFLVTFTLPYQLRSWVWSHQSWAYQHLFSCAQQTLLSFFARDKQLGNKAGMVGVLHTHSRQLNFHPHVHFVVPAGAFNRQGSLFKQKQGQYLFPANNLAKVFRGKFIAAMLAQGYHLPYQTPKEWVADCQYVGQGDSAFTYLARYLYRGVINEQNILSLTQDKVAFQYQNSQSKAVETLTENATDFLWRVIQHVLPKGFRRARNYGFLHGNAKRMLKRIQCLLKVRLPDCIKTAKLPLCCPCCHEPMTLLLLKRGDIVITNRTR